MIILADDLGRVDVGAYGNPEVKTPHLDRLAQRGVMFTRAYNMGSSQPAVCVASRTMLVTSRFLWPMMRENSRDDIAAGRLWSQQMKRAGYTTYFTGKWHAKGQPTELFDHTKHVRGGMPASGNAAYNRPIQGQPDRWDPANPKIGGHWQGGKHWAEVLADDSIEFVAQAARSDEPFFMYLAFNSPHDPRQSPREYLAMYDHDRLALPPNFLAEYPYKDSIGAGHVAKDNKPFPPGTAPEDMQNGSILRDERLAPYPRTAYAVRTHRHEYYAMISHMDAQIGRILEALEQAGKLDNTVIVFTADHGLAVGRHGLMGKQNMYEHSLGVPFIMAGPGVPRGEERHTPIYLQDVVPTSIELAGAETPDFVQFRSVLPILKNDSVPHYPAIFGAYIDHQRAIIDGPHKLIMYPSIGKLRLFNLDNDPHEIKDLAQDSKHKPLIRQLLASFKKLQVEMGDDLDIAAAYPGWFQ